MTRKPHSNSIIDALPSDQRARIEHWLFEENLSYRRVGELCRKLWQINVSKNAFPGYYHRIAAKRELVRIASSATSARACEEEFRKNPTDYYRLLDKMLGQIAFEMTLERNREDKKFEPGVVMQFVKLLLDGQKLSLAWQKWEFDAARACREHLATIQSIEADTSLDDDEKLNRIRLRLFGSAPK